MACKGIIIMYQPLNNILCSHQYFLHRVASVAYFIQKRIELLKKEQNPSINISVGYNQRLL